MDFAKDHWPLIAGTGFATGAVGYLLCLVRLRWRGSRRSSKHWAKTLELFGDLELLKLGLKRINPDTVDTEGDAASLYYQQYFVFHYVVEGGIRYCFKRSCVREVYAWFQWETERKLGANLMTQVVPDAPIECCGLEEKVDAKGTKYWVKVPVRDVFDSKELLSDLTNVAA